MKQWIILYEQGLIEFAVMFCVVFSNSPSHLLKFSFLLLSPALLFPALHNVHKILFILHLPNSNTGVSSSMAFLFYAYTILNNNKNFSSLLILYDFLLSSLSLTLEGEFLLPGSRMKERELLNTRHFYMSIEWLLSLEISSEHSKFR